MENIIIELDGKDYEVKEPTIQNWAMLNLLKDIEEEDDFILSLLSISTGIDEDLLKEVNVKQIKEASNWIIQHHLEEGERFYPEFEFKGKEYKFLDLNNLSFGHFVDIDTFLTKDESYKKGNMNELMSMLYMEKDEDKYNNKKVQERKELFRDLPVKYLQGSLLFFLTLRKRLHENTPFFLKMKWKVMRMLKRLKHLVVIGVGMGRLFFWQGKILKTWTK